MMRITGGRMKGRLLAVPKGLKIRPTKDQVRQAIFNVLGQDLSGLRVLDLFAGTGSLGLESLSRGAELAVFIDNSPVSIAIIKKNISLCGCDKSGFVFRRDLKKGLPLKPRAFLKDMDLVFADPPYAESLIPALLNNLSTGGVLSSGSKVVVESARSEILPDMIGGLIMFSNRLYGDTRISLYHYEAKR